MGRPLPSLLDDALQEPRIAPLLRSLAAERFGPGAVVRGVAAAVLQRRVVRYTVDVSRHADEPRFAWRVIGKVCDSEAAGRQEFAVLQRLAARGFGAAPPRSVGVPEAYAFAPELGLLLMQDVGGTALKKLVKERRARPLHLRRFAQALVKLHGFPTVVEVPYTLDDHLAQRCAGQCGALAASFPELAGEVGAIVAGARELLGGEPALAHGDCHLGQLHLDGPAAWLLDFEQLRLGDPAYDVALVVMQLARLALGGGRELYARGLRDAFLRRYFAAADLHIAARVPVNTALALLKRACKRVRWQDEPAWRDAVRAQIRQAAECIALQRATRPPRGIDEVLALCDRCPATA